MAFFPSAVRALLFGTPFGETYPPRPNPAAPSSDGRTVALEVLREYVASLTFYRAGGVGQPPIAFRIPEDHFYLEWPDVTESMVLPCVTIVGSRGTYDTIGLTCYVEENTRDQFAPGTVLQWQSEYVETIQLEVWASKIAERRALIAGLETAFSPTEQMSGLRFRMPRYYNELVCFSLNRAERFDDADSAKNRRRAQLELEMRFNVVALVNYQPLQPAPIVQVDVDENGAEIDLSRDVRALASVAGDYRRVVARAQAENPPNPAFQPATSSFTSPKSR